MGRAPRVADSSDEDSQAAHDSPPPAPHNAKKTAQKLTLKFSTRPQPNPASDASAEDPRSLQSRPAGSADAAASSYAHNAQNGYLQAQGRPVRGSTAVEPWPTFQDPTALTRSASGSRHASDNQQQHFASSINPHSTVYAHQQQNLAPNSDSYQQESDDLGGFGPTSDPPAGRKIQKTSQKQQAASGSEYGEEPDAEGESDSEDVKPASGRRKIKKGSSDEDYFEDNAGQDDDDDDDDEDEDDVIHNQGRVNSRRGTTTSSGRPTRNTIVESDDSGDVEIATRGSRKLSRKSRNLSGFVDDDEEDEEDFGYGEKRPSQRADRHSKLQALSRKAAGVGGSSRSTGRRTRNSAMATIMDSSDNEWTPHEDEGYVLRQRKNVSYAIPTLDQLQAADAAQQANLRDGRAKGGNSRGGNGGAKRSDKLPLNMTGRQLDRLFGGKPIDSSDDDMGTPRKRAFTSGLLAGSAGAGNLFAGGGGSGMLPSGTPNNLGKVGDAALADTDPLLPAVPVTFDQVGGMEQHVQQLKEMVQLPLLYPEVFQRFAITPPRGVLFHGPPGTGKTLLARALAASCSSEGQKISFFMRKGADCLSKWVGEAERQLRLLFDEAKAQQPSIIFFDEIDGLAPVRSSKQEQIHASIVSTLLALMDGMDGRGQVVVIGATNRPDSVDPALRRPGRFDREFYFPLPNREARRKIIDIHTKGWEPGLEDDFKDQLAQMTKGYGGADMRALCTEAALNAVQRTYPQIYKSVDRLLIKPEKITVTPRDFMLSAKNIIPSTARSTSSVAAPLPAHLQPLLGSALEHAKQALSKSLPDVRKVNILEEAEYVQSEGSFEHEQMLQNFEKMRVYRPRLVIHGQQGMGQNFIGPAILQHLEGFHVQSMDLGRLVSDSARAAEAAVVEMFAEAKRHKPSIVYIPNLVLWANSVSDIVKATLQGLLDAMDPSEPILLMAVVDGLLKDVPFDVRSWFGILKSSRVLLEKPSAAQRREYFNETLVNIQKTPKQFPDAMPKKKRKLEILPKAPPLPPRQPTEAELARQMQNDATLREYLKFKLGPLIMDLKKRYKRFCRPIGNDYVSPTVVESALPPVDDAAEGGLPQPGVDGENGSVPTQNDANQNGVSQHHMDVDMPDSNPFIEQPVASTSDAVTVEGPVTSSGTAPQIAPVEGVLTIGGSDQSQAQASSTLAIPEPEKLRYVDVDLDLIHRNIYQDVYLTTDAFLEDLRHIVNNSRLDPDPEQFAKASSMLNLAIISIDQVADPGFKEECSRMEQREKQRRKAARAKARAEAAAVNAAAQAQEATEGGSETPLTQKAPGTVEGDAERPNLKRSAEEDNQDPAAKRVRIEEPTPNDPPQANTADVQDSPLRQQGDKSLQGKSPLSNGIVYTHEGPQSPTPGASAPATSEPPANEQKEPTEEPIGEEEEEEPVEPEEPDPPFVLPQDGASSLKQSLEFGTHELNVDELEQLRAALMDHIWRARKDWDRTSLVSDLRELVEEFLQECAEMKAAAAQAARTELE